MADMIKATLIRSPIGRCRQHKETVARLGLKRLNHSVTKQDSPEIRGMIRKVGYMLRVEHISNDKALGAKQKTAPQQSPAMEEEAPEQSADEEEEGDA